MKKEKLCVCYANNMHLGVILLEYLMKENDAKVQTFFEVGIEDEINKIMKIKNKKTGNCSNLLKNIKFNKTKIMGSYEDNGMATKNVFVIRGSDQYIKNAINFIEKNNEYGKKIKIIICYDFENQIENLKEYSKVIVTKGEKDII